MGRLITGAGYTGTVGGSITVYGTPERQTITVADVAGTVTFDPSFNKGGDTIVLAKSAASYTVTQSGSTVVLSDGDSRIIIPVGTTANAIQFSDGDRALLFSGGVKIGSQAVTTTAATITATGTTKSTLAADAATQAARLVLSEESASVGGSVMVYGTAGVESVSVVGGGRITFDPSFNKGGDILNIPFSASEVSAQRAGSSVLLKNENVQLTVPVGTSGATINLSGDARSLKFVDGAFKLGQSSVTADLTPVYQVPSALTKNYLKIGYYDDSMNGHVSDADFSAIFARAKSYGFGGVNFELSASVDAAGTLQDKLKYDRLWQVIELAKRDGLAVSIQINWVVDGNHADYIDARVVNDNAKIDIPNLIKSISTFFDKYSSNIDKSGADTTIIYSASQPQIFLNNNDDWIHLFNSISSNLKSLTSVCILYALSEDYSNGSILDISYIYSALDFISLWERWDFTPDNNDPNSIEDNLGAVLKLQPAILESITKISDQYAKPISMSVTAFATPHALDGGWDPTFAELTAENPKVYPSLMLEAFQSSLFFVEKYLGNIVDNYTIGNFELWARQKFSEPQYDNWKLFDLSTFPEAIFAELQKFNQTSEVSAAARIIDPFWSNTLRLGAGDDQVLVSGGYDQIFGGAGNDKIIINDKPYTLNFTYKQWFDKNSKDEQYIEVYVNSGDFKKQYSVEKVKVDWWGEREISISSNTPIKKFSIYIPQGSNFIDIGDISYISSVNGGWYDIYDGIKDKNLKFDWAKPEWLLTDDKLTFTNLDVSGTTSTRFFGGAGFDEVVLESLNYGRGSLELFDVERVVNASGQKIADLLPRTKMVFIGNDTDLTLTTYNFSELLSAPAKLSVKMSGGALNITNTSKFVGFDTLDAVVVEDGVRWETRFVFVISEVPVTSVTFG